MASLKTHFPRDWDSRIVVVPSDCSYESADLRVYNQHTELWGTRALHFFQKQNQCFLNQAPLDKVEKTMGPDPIRGTIKASYGYCTDMSCSRTEEEADMGLASPNISQNNKDNSPHETYGPFSRLCEHLQVEWADYDQIVADEKRKHIMERFSLNPKLCPPELSNRVNAFTHARIPLFQALDQEAEAGAPPSIVGRSLWGLDEPVQEEESLGPDFWEKVETDIDGGDDTLPDLIPPGDWELDDDDSDEELLALVSEDYPCPDGLATQKFAPVQSNGNTLTAHVDSHNTEGSAVVCWSDTVRHNGVLYRDSFIMYDRKSLQNFASHHDRYGPQIARVGEYVRSLPHPALSLPDLAGYSEVLGDQGVVFVVAARVGRLMSCAAKTTAALNKQAAFASAFGSAIRKLHQSRPLTLFQLLTLVRIGSSCNKVLPFVTILGYMEQVGLPGPNLLPFYEALAVKIFGGHNIGPCQRHSPHHTQAWERETFAASIAILGEIITTTQLAQTRRSRSRESVVKTMLPKELQDCVEQIMAQLCKIKGIQDLTAQVAFGLILQLGLISNAKLSEHTTHSGASAMFKGKKLSDEEMSKVLKAVAHNLGITVSMAENAGCETNRKSVVVDLAPANSFFIGNPTPIVGGGHQMQTMTLDTGIWEQLAAVTPLDNGKQLGDDIEEHVRLSRDMPDSVPIRDAGGKTTAQESYYVVELPPLKGLSTYDGLIEAIAKRCPDESYTETMDRVRVHLEAHLGCSISEKEKVMAKAKTRTRQPKGTQAAGKGGSRAQQTGPSAPAHDVEPPAASQVLTGVQNRAPNTTSNYTKESFTDQVLTGIPNRAFSQALGAGESLLELTGQAESMLRHSGVIRRSGGAGLGKKSIVTTLGTGKLDDGKYRAGYYATLPMANLDFSDSNTSVVGTSISTELFGGFKVLDTNTLTPKVLFPTKSEASKCLLFLAVILQGTLCPDYAVALVTRLFQKRNVAGLWQPGCLLSLKLRVQGLPGYFGYFVMKDRTCWYVYEVGQQLSATHNHKPQFKFFEFAVNESGAVSRASPRKRPAPASQGASFVGVSFGVLTDENKKTKA